MMSGISMNMVFTDEFVICSESGVEVCSREKKNDIQ